VSSVFKNFFEEIFMASFGERLKLLRAEKKLRQIDIAEILNITDRQYQLYEYGKSFPDFKKLIMLADFFDVSLDYLVGRK
jgi:transcriptional regulator with XRE-family HTH domain